MLWEYVYIGSQIVRSSMVGLCNPLPTKEYREKSSLSLTDPVKAHRKNPKTNMGRSNKNKTRNGSTGLEETKSLWMLLPLEPRIMFDGAALATGAEVVQDQITQDLDLPALNTNVEPEKSSDPLTNNIDLSSALSTETSPSDRKEIVFIDTRVEDYQSLLRGIDPSAEAILLDSTRDGIEQMAEALNGRININAIHLIAEGNEAELHLGTTFLTQESISGQYADLFTQIGKSLSAEADLLIYGCNFGEGKAGLDAIETLAELTGADIAASTNRTGHTTQYADWDLEISTGTIESSIVIDESTQATWEGVLATFTVTTTTDGGAGSLRQAIIDANANPGTDTITFVGSGTYLLTIAGAGEDAAATGDLDITEDLIIIGNGAGNTVIDASGFGGTPDRVFHVGGVWTATISGVTIQGGDQDNGGGIFVEHSSILNLSDAMLTGNTNSGTGNAGSGGAIHVHGTANLDRVLMSGNSAESGGAIGFHGADGGSLTNVTISGNTSTGNGGGLWTDTPITVTNSTFTLNHGNNGGGIFAQSATVTISNTILSDNTTNSTNEDVVGNYNSDSFNLIQDIGSATGLGSDITGVSANLDVLADNGGPTQTHALLGGSLAIDAGTTTGAPTVDQRIFARDSNPDIGAFEANATGAPTLDLDTNDSSGATGNDYVFTFTEGDGPTTIADSDTDLVDLDSVTFASVKLVVSGLLDGNAETLVLDGDTFALATAVAGQNTSGGNYHVVITTGSGTATVTITKQGGGTFNETETENLIEAIQYQHTDSSTPTDGNRLIDVTVNDGIQDSVAAQSTINVNPVNEVPVNVVPVAQTTLEDTTLVFSSGTSNQISISDPDAGSSDVQVTLIAANGTVTLAGTAGLTFRIGDGTADATMTFTGTIPNINTALDGLMFDPTPSYSGPASLEITTEDLGNTGDAPLDGDANITTKYTFNIDGTDAIGTNDATLNNGAAVVADAERGNVLTVDGADDYAEVPSVATNGLSQFTLSFWVKTTESGSSGFYWTRPTLLGMEIPGFGQNEINIITNNGFIGFWTGLSGGDANYLSTTTQINDNQWHQITVSNDGANASLYVDGVFETSLATGNGLTNLPFYIGAQNSNGTDAHHHSGLFDDVRIFNRSLTSQEAKDLYTLSDTDNVSITVTANNAPVNTVPAAVNVDEDTSLAMTGGNLISVTDVDGNLATTQLTVTQGTVTVTLSGGATISAGANGTSTLTISGTETDINATLASLIYQGNQHYNGPDTLTVTSTDSAGTPLNDIDVVNITVNSINDAPAFSGLDNTPTFTEGGAAVVLDNNATIADPELDALDNYDGATLTLVRNGGSNANDVFNGSGTLNPLVESGSLVVNSTTIGSVTTNSGGTLMLTFNSNATTALVNSTLQQITYRNTNGTPPASVQIDYTIDDGNAGAQGSGGARNDSGSITVTINATNTAPTLDLDADDSSPATGNNYRFPYFEGDGPTAIADIDADLVDVDSTTFASVKLAVSSLLDGNAETLILDGDTFALATSVAGLPTSGGNYHVVISTGAGTATVTITKQGGGLFNEAETETLITAIQYQHTDTDAPTEGNRHIDVIVNDGIADSAAARTTINLVATNDPPTATIVPFSYSFNEDDPYMALSGVSVSDFDAGTNDMSVTISVTDGSLRLGTTIGLTFVGGANDSATMTVMGTTTNLNNALATLAYQPNFNFSGSDLLTLSVDDLGNTGGGPRTDMDTATITVAPLNDPPVFTGLDNTPTFTEGGAAVVLDNNATIADPELDAANDYSGATLTLVRNGGANTEDLFDGSGSLSPLVESGNLVISGTTMGTVTTNSGGTLVLTFNSNATTALVNSTLQKITYANSSIFPPATVQINYTINDGNVGGQGSGGAMNDTGSITVTINSINAPPVATPDSFTVNEGSTNTLNLAINDTDADDGLDSASIAIISGPTNGAITAINTNGTVEYTHNGSETVADSFTYTINDLAGAPSNTVIVNLTITPQNDAPIITSDGGGASASVNILTGNTAATDVDAIDPEGTPLTYSIIGGADAALFSIDPTTGVLTFNNAPNFQTPGDADGDNIYDVIVQTSDGTATDTQTIAVTVADVPIVVPPPSPDPGDDSPSPSEDGDSESEEEILGSGLGITFSSKGSFSSNSQGSTEQSSKDSELPNNQGENDLGSLHQQSEKNSSGGTVSDILGFLQKPFGTGALKSEIQSLLTTSDFLRDLDRVREDFQEATVNEKTYVASSIAASTGLSIGYVFWLLRSGVLLTALLSSVPAWQFVNPLLVLDTPTRKKHRKGQEDLKDDSVESMFENHTVPEETSGTKTESNTQAHQSRWTRRT